VQEEFSALTTLAQENFAGVRVVRAYRQERAEIGRFASLNARYLEKNMRLARLYGIMHPMFGLLAGLSGVMVLGLGGSLAVRGTITVGRSSRSACTSACSPGR
jgi:ATP-binding cassette subfamily B protein